MRPPPRAFRTFCAPSSTRLPNVCRGRHRHSEATARIVDRTVTAQHYHVIVPARYVDHLDPCLGVDAVRTEKRAVRRCDVVAIGALPAVAHAQHFGQRREALLATRQLVIVRVVRVTTVLALVPDSPLRQVARERAELSAPALTENAVERRGCPGVNLDGFP